MISNSLKRFYDPAFTVSEAYRNTLPDLQNGPASLIEGANVPIQQVGISNFRLPLKYASSGGKEITLETSVDGYVHLEAGKKGINMSRIIRTFYGFKEEKITDEVLEYILKAYKKNLDSTHSYLRLSFHYPVEQKSLRSNLYGYQYYPISLEGQIDANGQYKKFMTIDFTYSSACPCSYELAEHAREIRDVAAISHSQRSISSVILECKNFLPPENLVQMMRDALVTETQVMVKREDEQAFAEQNGAAQKFVEDAARLVYERLNRETEITDFLVRCNHMESLHSHDAISRICKGVPGGMR